MREPLATCDLAAIRRKQTVRQTIAPWRILASLVCSSLQNLIERIEGSKDFSFRAAGDSFLDQLGLSHNTLGRDLGILAAMVGIYISAACVLLYLRVKAGRMMRMRP